MCAMILKNIEIDVQARKMCSLKFGTTELKTKENDNSGDDV